MRILLIEDEKILRVSLDKSLTKAGYTVSTCEDGSEALSNLAKNKYDIVLTDIRLPNADGFEILNYISTNCPKTKVIMMTSVDDKKVIDEAFRLGAEDYITKPFSLNYLEKVVMLKVLNLEINRLGKGASDEKPEESI